MALLVQDGEQAIDLIHGFLDARLIGADEGAHLKVFLHRHAGKDVLGLGDKAHALAHAGLRRELGDVLAIQHHTATAQVQHAESRFHGGGFARAIRADDHGNLALVHGNGAVVQDVDGAVAPGHILADEEGFSHGRPPL